MDLFSSEIINAVFTHSNPGAFAEKFFLFLAAWKVVKKSVAADFTEMKTGLKVVTGTLQEMCETLKRTEINQVNHHERIEKLEIQQTVLMNEIIDLKKGVIK